jgi:branched-subunit amino acid transport protein
MTWPAFLVLALGSYALKAAGLVALRNRTLPPFVEDVLALLPAAMFGGLVMVSTFGGDRALVLDARAAGLAVAALALWRRAGPVVVVTAAVVTTAVMRALA